MFVFMFTYEVAALDTLWERGWVEAHEWDLKFYSLVPEVVACEKS